MKENLGKKRVQLDQMSRVREGGCLSKVLVEPNSRPLLLGLPPKKPRDWVDLSIQEHTAKAESAGRQIDNKTAVTVLDLFGSTILEMGLEYFLDRLFVQFPFGDHRRLGPAERKSRLVEVSQNEWMSLGLPTFPT
jgi:hypothetical protein